MAASSAYRGRFAPTPSGPLHFGSLVAAVASYLDARAHGGEWLLRIEDVDKPRALPGAAQTILQQLHDHGLQWHGEVIYQSQRDTTYAAALHTLQQRGLTYYCSCTRKQIKARGPYYTCYCRDKKRRAEGNAVRFRNEHPCTEFQDRILGKVQLASDFAAEDFVLFRRDQLYTYQLAVVVDDIAQGITDIVRGADLLTPTSWQLTLWSELATYQPRFAHVPLALDQNGNKLSKQNHAPALSAEHVHQQLRDACAFLGLTELPKAANTAQLLSAATAAWHAKYLS